MLPDRFRLTITIEGNNEDELMELGTEFENDFLPDFLESSFLPTVINEDSVSMNIEEIVSTEDLMVEAYG